MGRYMSLYVSIESRSVNAVSDMTNCDKSVNIKRFTEFSLSVQGHLKDTTTQYIHAKFI